MKKELVYEKILVEALEEKKTRFTQLETSRELGVSLSTVNNALRPLVKMGGVVVKPRGCRVADLKKILVYWATARNPGREVAYSTRVKAGVSEIEKSMPAGTLYTAYSGYKHGFGGVPADYSEVYVYADAQAIEEIRKRFPARKGPANLVVLLNPEAKRFSAKGVASLPRIYADLWNLREWYAKEFLNALEEKLPW